MNIDNIANKLGWSFLKIVFDDSSSNTHKGFKFNMSQIIINSLGDPPSQMLFIMYEMSMRITRIEIPEHISSNFQAGILGSWILRRIYENHQKRSMMNIVNFYS